MGRPSTTPTCRGLDMGIEHTQDYVGNVGAPMTLIDSKIGGELAAWRARLGFTQAEAAERLGINLRTYEGWEIGRHAPSTGEVLRIAMKRIEAFELAEQARKKKERRRVVHHS